MGFSTWSRGRHLRRDSLTIAAGLLVTSAVVLAGCSTAPPPAASSATATPSAAPLVRPECAAVTAAATTVSTELVAYLAGQGNPEQLRTSAQNLSSALSQARTDLGADGARLDAASAAVQQLTTALQAQPIDPQAVRAAAQQVLAALGEVASVCSAASGSQAPSSSPPTSTS